MSVTMSEYATFMSRRSRAPVPAEVHGIAGREDRRAPLYFRSRCFNETRELLKAGYGLVLQHEDRFDVEMRLHAATEDPHCLQADRPAQIGTRFSVCLAPPRRSHAPRHHSSGGQGSNITASAPLETA